MPKKKVAEAKSNKSCIWKLAIEMICLILCMLCLIYLNIKTRNDYNSKGFSIIYSSSESLFFMVLFFFLFIFIVLGVFALRGVLLKKWDMDKKIELLILSISVVVFLNYIIIFLCGPTLIFSKDEINYKSFSSKTHNWSDVAKIEIYATKVSGSSKSSPYLYGTYTLYFSDGTNINLWDRNDGFIEHYKEINDTVKNIVKKNNISVYKIPIDKETRDFIKQEYGKKQEDIIFQIVG